MTFAQNDLVGVKAETDKIWKSVKKNKAVNAKKVANVSIDKLAEAVIDAGKDLFMFHFGGHADQKHLVLDGFKDIDKIRLSRILLPNDKHNVQLIFLNGCLSYGHVGVLTAKGVKAIIATNVKVNDAEAVRIAAFFYKLFFEKNYTLKAAFETAEATVSGKNAYITIVNPGEIDENQPLPSAWTLFVHAKHNEVMNWTLTDFFNATTSNGPKDGVTPSQTATTPTHSGSGVNVGRDNIGRQINMGNNSTYIENQQNTGSPSTNNHPLSTKDAVNGLLIKGQLNNALDTLSPHLPDEQNTVILLKSRVFQLEQNEILGILSNENANMERNRIKNAILSLLNQLA